MSKKLEDEEILLDLEEIELLELDELPLKLEGFKDVELLVFEDELSKLQIISSESLTELKEVLSILNNLNKDERINRAIKLIEDVIKRES